MGLILTLILGGLAGWIASIILNRNQDQGIAVNVIVGIIGAFLANVVIAPLVGVKAELSTLSLESFLVAVLGSVILLAIVNLVTRRSIR